jgi:iron complex outermembrane receptor protein
MKVSGNIGYACLIVIVCLLTTAFRLNAQNTYSLLTAPDTLYALVKAYETNRPLARIPASVSLVKDSQFMRFTNTSLVSALNMQPGVRIEERSPGSYRVNMRGSSVRSPFGVRNVKVYFNELPFTDPGGNTYLNELDFRNIQSMEIIKGPASSLYGAGSGGTILLHTLPAISNKNAGAEILTGSYGLFAANVNAGFGQNNTLNRVQYTHQQSNGWRNHTNLRRDIVTLENRLNVSAKQTIQTVVLFGDLYYQTPGALTLAEYKANPQASRPAVGRFPSAVDGKAAVFQQNFLAGITNEYRISSKWKNTTAVYGAATWFKNPTFRLYEKRTEPHFGGRTSFSNDFVTKTSIIHLVYGAEAQKGIFSSHTYKNKLGNPDSILTNDEINNWRYSVFTQADWLFGKGWNVTAGASYNKLHIGVDRLFVYPVTTQEKTFSSDIAPRLAVLKSFRNIHIYASATKGFSPPTNSELLPGNAIVNTTLKAESGFNYEAGFKGTWKRLTYDASYYWYDLTNAISLRRDNTGGDFYVNAGKRKQQGIEALASYSIMAGGKSIVKYFDVFSSYTGNFYSYADYKVVAQDYSGKSIPGIAKHTWVLAANATFAGGIYSNISYQFVDKIALNDANTEYANAYHLLSVRVGCHILIQNKSVLDIFVAGDNLLDEIYSLGNDINAAGGRYYNAAAKRNFSAGVSVSLK